MAEVNGLPFVPWWHHPNANYVGRHRGTYQFWPKGTMLSLMPIGKRNTRIALYSDLIGTTRITSAQTIKLTA